MEIKRTRNATDDGQLVAMIVSSIGGQNQLVFHGHVVMDEMIELSTPRTPSRHALPHVVIMQSARHTISN